MKKLFLFSKGTPKHWTGRMALQQKKETEWQWITLKPLATFQSLTPCSQNPMIALKIPPEAPGIKKATKVWKLKQESLRISILQSLAMKNLLFCANKRANISTLQPTKSRFPPWFQLTKSLFDSLNDIQVNNEPDSFFHSLQVRSFHSFSNSISIIPQKDPKQKTSRRAYFASQIWRFFSISSRHKYNSLRKKHLHFGCTQIFGYTHKFWFFSSFHLYFGRHPRGRLSQCFLKLEKVEIEIYKANVENCAGDEDKIIKLLWRVPGLVLKRLPLIHVTRFLHEELLCGDCFSFSSPRKQPTKSLARSALSLEVTHQNCTTPIGFRPTQTISTGSLM